VQMWKPSSVVEAMENLNYVEEHMNLNGGMSSTFLYHPGFVGKAPRTFSRGGRSRPPPYGNRVAPRIVVVGISMAASATSHSSLMTQVGPQPSQRATSRGRGSRRKELISEIVTEQCASSISCYLLGMWRTPLPA
jgi:hypothetical protein